MTYEIKTLALSAIRTNGGTQTRVQLNAAAVKEYGEAMTEGVHFPPVIVFFDGTDHWLADGFHRVQASMDIGALSITSEVRPGDQRAARLFSTGANGAHGVPPTSADKRRAVMTLLNDAEWGAWSDREVARQCKVSNHLVASVRRELQEAEDRKKETHLGELPDSRPESHLGELPDSPAKSVKKVSRGGKTYEMKTDGVSKANKARATPADAPTVATPPEKRDEAPGPVVIERPATAAALAKAAKQESKAVEENVSLKARIAELEEELSAYQENCADLRDEVKALSAAVDPNHAKKFLEQSGYVRVLESQRNELLDKNARLAREVKSLQKRLGHV